MAIRVDSFDGILIPTTGAWSHVCEEVLEFLPAFADSNTATAIILICTAVFIIAAFAHGAPSAVGQRTGSRHAVCYKFWVLTTDMSARFGVTVAQQLAKYDGCFAAGASAFPKESAISLANRSDCSKVTELFAGDIDESGHDDLLQGSCAKWRLGADHAESPRIIAEAV